MSANHLSSRYPCSTAWPFLLAMAVTMHTAAQPTNVSSRRLSLRDCIALSLEHNLDLRIQRYEPRMAGYRLRSLRGVYDPVLSVYTKRNFLDQPARVNADNLRRQTFADDLGRLYTVTFIDTQNRYEQRVDSVGGGLIGKLPTGLQYELAVVNDYRNITAFPLPGQTLPFGQTNDNYVNVALTLRQPLLKDFWIDGDRLSIQLAKRDLKISEAEMRARMMTNITDVMMAYYDLVYARGVVRVNEKAAELTRQLLTETRTSVQAGQLPPLDVKQAESLLETVQADVVAARQLEADKQNDLKVLITDDLGPWLHIEIEPTETLLVSVETLDRARSWQAALEHRPDLQELRLQLEKRKMLVRYSRNQLYPSLDLMGGMGVQAYGANNDGAWRSVRDGDHPFYSIGLMLSFPLGRTSARNNHKLNLAAQEQAVLRLQKRELKAMAAVDTALRGVESAFKRVESTGRARGFAEDALGAEQLKFRSGESTSFLVLQFQRSLTAARTAEIQALADYHKARAQLQLEEGTTLFNNQLEVSID